MSQWSESLQPLLHEDEEAASRGGVPRENGAGKNAPGRARRMLSMLLLVSLFAVVLGSSVTVCLLLARVQGVTDMSVSSAFVPIWVGNTFSFIFQLVALCSFCVLARNVTRERTASGELQVDKQQGAPNGSMDYHNDSQPQAQVPSGSYAGLLSSFKFLCGWTCCIPFMNLLPPIPLLVFLTWFEVNTMFQLTERVDRSAALLATPLFVFEAIALVQALLVRGSGLLSRLFFITLLATSVLVVLQLDNVIHTSWFFILAPTWLFLACCAVMVLSVTRLALLPSGKKTSKRVRFSETQVFALGCYTCSMVLFTAFLSCLCINLDSFSKTGRDKGAFSVYELPFSFYPMLTWIFAPACSMLAMGALFVAQEYLSNSLGFVAGIKNVPMAWRDRPGVEYWGLLGEVNVYVDEDDLASKASLMRSLQATLKMLTCSDRGELF